jgi:hypothetical protein
MAANDKNDLLIQIANELPDNTNGDINPSNIRTTESAMVTYNVNTEELTQQDVQGVIEFKAIPTINGDDVSTAVKLDSEIVVKVAADFGVVDSTKVYLLDGIVDFTGTGLNIEVPAGGINIIGSTFNVSGLICTDVGYTLFTSPVGGSGDVLRERLFIEISGAGSQVYDLTDSTGLHAIEEDRVNYNNCTSLGTITDYRQGLEAGTGRFGGTPELTLAGTWLGGYFIDTSIVRNLSNSAFTLYKAGAGFTMASRFRSNQNIDLPALASFLDFAPANFTNPSTLQLEQCIITRNGASDASDSNLTPNILSSDLQSSWTGNNGLSNTFPGGELNITAETTTTIVSSGVFVDLAGTYATSDLQHFDEPTNGQLRHLGSSPLDFKVGGQLVLECSSNDEVDVKLVIFRDATTSFEDGKTLRRVINNLQGGRDVAYFVLDDNVTLNQNDYIKIQVANVAATNNITAEIDSYINVGAR